MATPKFDRDRAAAVIVEAALLGDRKACEKNGIADRTLRRWRSLLANDPELAETIRSKRALVERDWAEELPEAIRAAIGFLKRAGEEANPKDPDSIHSVAGALKILTDVTMGRRILDARLAKQNAGSAGQAGPAGEAPGPGAEAGEGGVDSGASVTAH